MNAPHTTALSMGDPAIYRVRVRGQVDPKWMAGLDELNRTEETLSNGAHHTVLVGRLADQAALSGLLTALYEMHLPIIAVDCLDVESS